MKHLLLLPLLLLGTVAAFHLGKSSPSLLTQIFLSSSFLHLCVCLGARVTAFLLQLTQLFSGKISPGLRTVTLILVRLLHKVTTTHL